MTKPTGSLKFSAYLKESYSSRQMGPAYSSLTTESVSF